jgi:hypothetical protein
MAPVDAPPPPLVLSTCRPRLATRRRLLSTSPPRCLSFAGWFSCCISSCRLHFASPFIVPPRVHPRSPAFICTGWLLHCISLRCLCLLSSRQHHCLSTCRCLTSRRQLHLPFTSSSPRLVATLPLVTPPPHICQLALPSASTSCHISFSLAPASCRGVSSQPATLQPPPSIASPANGWLLRFPARSVVRHPLSSSPPPSCIGWSSTLRMQLLG